MKPPAQAHERVGVPEEVSASGTIPRPVDAARLEHTSNLPDRLARLTQPLHRRGCPHSVERGIGEIKRVDVAVLEPNVRDRAFLGGLAGTIKSAVIHVDADDLLGRQELREIDGDRTWSAAAVQKRYARLEVRQEERGARDDAPARPPVGERREGSLAHSCPHPIPVSAPMSRSHKARISADSLSSSESRPLASTRPS